jgi:ribonuclease HI
MPRYPETLTLEFDGAAEPTNPGIGSWGWLFRTTAGDVIHSCGGVVVGQATNNEAESHALGHGLRHLADAKWVGSLLCRGDSMLVVRQMSGEWQCNKDTLRRLRDRCRELAANLGEVSFEWVSREWNQAADDLSRLAWEAHTGHPFPERRRRP